jgi:hypothetical protein
MLHLWLLGSDVVQNPLILGVNVNVSVARRIGGDSLKRLSETRSPLEL